MRGRRYEEATDTVLRKYLNRVILSIPNICVHRSVRLRVAFFHKMTVLSDPLLSLLPLK